jgi:integrase
MAPKPSGQVIEPKDGRAWAIRFPAYGKRRYITLGTTDEGWNRQRAERELGHVMADVERGIWRLPEPEPEPIQEPRPEPTFHEFASEWFERHRREWRPNTIADYQWSLTYHLLPTFRNHRLSAITVAEVDRYKARKLAEGRLAPGQINKTLTRLAQILGEAVEYELIARNPASGRRRRVNAPKTQRTWVEPEQLSTLLESATGTLRPILAVLAGCGLRVGEAVARDWRDVSIPTATIDIGRAKTDAGVRQVDVPIGPLQELSEWRARRPTYRGEGDPVFITEPPNGTPASRQNRRNVAAQLKTAIDRANARLPELGIEPISERVTPHSLRRTYASLRAACGDDPVYIAEQGGWTDPTFALRVYAKAVKRRAKLSGMHLREFDRALEWAGVEGGASADQHPFQAANGQRAASEAPERGGVTQESPAIHE